MVFIDRPRFVPLESYDEAVDRMCWRFAGLPGLRCIFQIGHVSTPGISDIDLLFVFEEDGCLDVDPLAGLSALDRYLFVHSPFAVCVTNYSDALRHTFFHNYRLIHGTAPGVNVQPLSVDEQETLKRQIALEYLVRIFASLSVEVRYGVIKLRNLFLHAKAMLYDCEFLKVQDGPFLHTLRRIVEIRTQWFEKPPQKFALIKEVQGLYEELRQFLVEQFRKQPLFVPDRTEHLLAKHLRLSSAEILSVRHKGILLPALFTGLGRRFFNVQHRFNKFEFGLPFRASGYPPIVEQAFSVRDRLEDAGRKRFPRFLRLATNLALQDAPTRVEIPVSQPKREVSLSLR